MGFHGQGFSVYDVGFRMQVRSSGLNQVLGLLFIVQGSGLEFRVQGVGFRVQSLGFKIENVNLKPNTLNPKSRILRPKP